MIHPVGDHNHRSNFLQNQIPVIRMERSTDFFRFKKSCLSAYGSQLRCPMVSHLRLASFP
ncbi:MAG: hypothetical protein P8179_19390 [Candidatus Thiodiazotropha sp.]